MRRTFADVLDAVGAAAGVTRGRMFGAEGLKFGGKVFAMEVKGRLVVKVSRARASALVEGGAAVAFDPGHGRPMKEWVSVAPEAPIDWVELAREALVAAGA